MKSGGLISSLESLHGLAFCQSRIKFQSCQLSRIERLTHFTTFSRSHADMLISHANFLLLLLSEVLWCTKRRVPLLCACKIDAKMLRSEKKCRSPLPPPPPPHQLFLDLRDFIGWQRTALAFLTPNPHPMLAALKFHHGPIIACDSL